MLSLCYTTFSCQKHIYTYTCKFCTEHISVTYIMKGHSWGRQLLWQSEGMTLYRPDRKAWNKTSVNKVQLKPGNWSKFYIICNISTYKHGTIKTGSFSNTSPSRRHLYMTQNASVTVTIFQYWSDLPKLYESLPSYSFGNVAKLSYELGYCT